MRENNTISIYNIQAAYSLDDWIVFYSIPLWLVYVIATLWVWTAPEWSQGEIQDGGRFVDQWQHVLGRVEGCRHC